MADAERIYALDLEERNNLDAEMTALVRGIEKKYGFMPHFIRLFATDKMIISTTSFYASANRIAQATGLKPAPQYLAMYREQVPATRENFESPARGVG